ncbi:sugar transferase [Pseudalkalibacillus hwajinpoensis]|uniref:sugar transferase n=1 Tax=Guptibacillus hwajinpoensis TaxID=208199 RepID=UPI001CFE4109|nr:sugar transferase [Pseudalkalibacillus hwajinpoensis]
MGENHTLYPSDKIEVNDRKVYLFLKRLVDVLGAASGILLLAPIYIFVAILIKVEDSQGPVFFKQKRIGKNGSEFNMYKFRSMVSNAEELLNDLLEQNEATGAMFKMKNDPRITKVGRFIRKTSIDELPQLWNVLKGEMSLVGPRPPLPREVAEYTEYDRNRLLVVPGCTGLWQVSGRSDIGFKEMVELDLLYIKNRSLFFDMKIMFKTLYVLAGSKGAF